MAAAPRLICAIANGAAALEFNPKIGWYWEPYARKNLRKPPDAFFACAGAAGGPPVRGKVKLERDDVGSDQTILIEDYYYTLPDKIGTAGLRLTEFEVIESSDLHAACSAAPGWICGALPKSADYIV
jgi:hypothetical protein